MVLAVYLSTSTTGPGASKQRCLALFIQALVGLAGVHYSNRILTVFRLSERTDSPHITPAVSALLHLESPAFKY